MASTPANSPDERFGDRGKLRKPARNKNKGRSNIGYPESPAAPGYPFQPKSRQLSFVHTEIGKVRKVGDDCLIPPVLCHEITNFRILVFSYVERQHREVLGRTRRSDGIDDRFRQVLRKKDSFLFELKYF